MSEDVFETNQPYYAIFLDINHLHRNPQPSMIPLNAPFSSENSNLYENTKYSTWYLDFILHLTFCLTNSCLAYLSHISQFSVQTCCFDVDKRRAA